MKNSSVVRFHYKAKEEFDTLSERQQNKFHLVIDMFALGSNIPRSKVKKLQGYKNLYELRIRDKSGIYRGLYLLLGRNILVTHFFQKKTQKTSKKEIKIALRRLKDF